MTEIQADIGISLSKLKSDISGVVEQSTTGGITTIGFGNPSNKDAHIQTGIVSNNTLLPTNTVAGTLNDMNIVSSSSTNTTSMTSTASLVPRKKVTLVPANTVSTIAATTSTTTNIASNNEIVNAFGANGANTNSNLASTTQQDHASLSSGYKRIRPSDDTGDDTVDNETISTSNMKIPRVE